MPFLDGKKLDSAYWNDPTILGQETEHLIGGLRANTHKKYRPNQRKDMTAF